MLVKEIWTQPADHHTGPRLLKTLHTEAPFRQIATQSPAGQRTEDRTRSPSLTVKNFLHPGRQPQKPERRIRLHFLPAYAPHLNSIEMLWGVMHEHVTHNRHYAKFDDFTEAILKFFRETLPKKGRNFRERVADNFRVISHKNHQIVQWYT